MINLEKKHLMIVENILSRYKYAFYVFGSRITNKAKKFSDLDLLYFDNISNLELMTLETEFEESDLPFRVDIVNYNKCDKDLQKIISNNYVCIYKPN